MHSLYSATINNDAREWFIVLQSGNVTALERQAFEQWLKESNEHQQAYADYQKIWNDLALLADTSAGRALKKPISSRKLSGLFAFLPSLTIYPQAALAFATVTIIVSAFLFLQPERINATIYQTNTGEIKQVTLVDGSEITLSGKSSIKAWFTHNERHVELVNGQAYFNIAKNSEKPFWVDIDNTLVKVVGTQFDINKNINAVTIAVAEGVVNIFATHPNKTEKITEVEKLNSTVLTKGMKITHYRDMGLTPIENIATNELAAWRSGKLIYRSEKLKNIIIDANRYFEGEIFVADSIAELEVTAAISISQINTLPETLAQLLPIKVRRESHKKVYLESK